MASGPLTPQGSGETIPPEPKVLSGELENVLYNSDERMARIEVLIRSTALTALAGKIPDKLNVSRSEAKMLERFITKIEEGIHSVQERNRKLTGDAHEIATVLSDGIDRIALILDRPDADQKLNAQLIGAIQAGVDAVRNLVAGFNVQLLDDATIWHHMKIMPQNRELTVASFVDVPEEKKLKPQLSFDRARGNDRLVADLFAAQDKNKGDVVEEVEKVPAFRWSWTDDELFASNQVPQIRKFTHDRGKLGFFIQELEKDLSTGFEEWQEQCKSAIASTQTFHNPYGSTLYRDDILARKNANFHEEVKKILQAIEECVRNGFWENEVAEAILTLEKRLEAHCKIKEEAPKPTSLFRPALDKIFARLKESEQLRCPFLPEKYISQTKINYRLARTNEKLGVNSKTVQDTMLSDTTVSDTSFDQTVQSFLRKAYDSDLVKKSNERAAAKEATTSLRNLLENFSSKNLEEIVVTSAEEQVKLYKIWLRETLVLISDFQFQGLSPRLLTILKNAASFHMCWNFRGSVLHDYLWFGLKMNEAKLSEELAHFFPEPPVFEEDKKNEWYAEVDAALPEMKVCSPQPVISRKSYDQFLAKGKWREQLIEACMRDRGNMANRVRQQGGLLAGAAAGLADKLLDAQVASLLHLIQNNLTKYRSFDNLPAIAGEKNYINCIDRLKKALVQEHSLKINGLRYLPANDPAEIIMHALEVSDDMRNGSSCVGETTRQLWDAYAAQTIEGCGDVSDMKFGPLLKIFVDVPHAAMQACPVKNPESYDEVKNAFEERLRAAEKALKSADYGTLTPDLVQKIQATFLYVFRHQLAHDYLDCLKAFPDLRPSDKKEYSKDPIMGVLFEVSEEKVPKEKKVNDVFSPAFLRNAWAQIRREALGVLTLMTQGKESKVENGVIAQLFSSDKEAALNAVMRKGEKVDPAKYLVCVQDIIGAIPTNITVGKDVLEVPPEFSAYLRDQLNELVGQLNVNLPQDATLDQSKETAKVTASGRVTVFDPFADIVAEAQKRRAAKQGGTSEEVTPVSTKKGTDPLQEALAVSDVPVENAGEYVSRLFTAVFEDIAVRDLRKMVTSHTQEHIEDITAELSTFTAMCTRIVRKYVSQVIQAGVAPTIEQLKTVAEKARQEILVLPDEGFSFVTSSQRESIIQEVCTSLTKPTIDAEDLFIENPPLKKPEAASDTSRTKDEPSPEADTPKLKRLRTAAKDFIDQRTRIETRRKTEEARVEYKEMEAQLGIEQGRIQDIVSDLVAKAGQGDPEAVALLKDYLNSQQTVRKALESRLPPT